jgi:hypothetical protein
MYFATPMLTSGQSLVIYDSDSDVSFGQQPSVSLRRSNRHDPMTDHIEAKNNSHPRSENSVTQIRGCKSIPDDLGSKI